MRDKLAAQLRLTPPHALHVTSILCSPIPVPDWAHTRVSAESRTSPRQHVLSHNPHPLYWGVWLVRHIKCTRASLYHYVLISSQDPTPRRKRGNVQLVRDWLHNSAVKSRTHTTNILEYRMSPDPSGRGGVGQYHVQDTLILLSQQYFLHTGCSNKCVTPS